MLPVTPEQSTPRRRTVMGFLRHGGAGGVLAAVIGLLVALPATETGHVWIAIVGVIAPVAIYVLWWLAFPGLSHSELDDGGWVAVAEESSLSDSHPDIANVFDSPASGSDFGAVRPTASPAMSDDLGRSVRRPDRAPADQVSERAFRRRSG